MLRFGKYSRIAKQVFADLNTLIGDVRETLAVDKLDPDRTNGSNGVTPLP